MTFLTFSNPICLNLFIRHIYKLFYIHHKILAYSFSLNIKSQYFFNQFFYFDGLS